MKRTFLLIVLSTLLVTLGFAQTPDAGSTLDPANVKGCLAGSDGNYTVTEDGTHQIFKITTSSVDLKPHLGHDVKLTGHKAGGAVSSGTADNSFAVTELSMISEHCAAAAAATTAALIPPSETVITPVQDATAPSATASAPAAGATAPGATASAPAADAAAPSATVNPSATVANPPAADTAAPATTVNPPAATASAPAADAATPASLPQPHPLRQSIRPRRLLTHPAVEHCRTSCDSQPVFGARSAHQLQTRSPNDDTQPMPADSQQPRLQLHRGESWPTRGHGHLGGQRMPPRLARLRTRPAQPLQMPQLPARLRHLPAHLMQPPLPLR